KRTARRQMVTHDRNNPDRYLALVFFDSYESAMENSNLPETRDLAEKYRAGTKDMVFTDLDVTSDVAMSSMAAGASKKSFESADETRTPDKTRVEVVSLGGAKAARFTLQPGWRWSECIKPIVGTEACQARHVGAVLSGSMHAVHTDGTEVDLGPGDAYVIE